MLRELFTFPERVNENAARFVAGFVVAIGVVVVAVGPPVFFLIPLLSVGFLLRVLAGPKLSPLALFVTKILLPALRIQTKLVAGAPKRFAQGIGFVVTAAASVLAFVVGNVVAVYAFVGVLLIAASLEAFIGFCLGCWMYGWLVRWGLIKEPTCESCIDFEI